MTAERRPAIFLDRDGTIIIERNYLRTPDQVALLPGAASALGDLRAAGFLCVVVTNQSGLGRGYLSEADLADVHREMQRQLAEQGAALDAIYYCPHVPNVADKSVIEHPDRKPGPGMLLRAARELFIDLSQSWMIGDGLADILAGRHAGCKGSILLRSGHDIQAALLHLAGEPVLDDLAAAAAWILK